MSRKQGAWSELRVTAPPAAYDRLLISGLEPFSSGGTAGARGFRAFFVRDRTGAICRLRVWVGVASASQNDVVGRVDDGAIANEVAELAARLRTVATHADFTLEVEVVPDSSPPTGPFGGPAAALLFAELLCDACPLQLSQLAGIVAGERRCTTAAVDILVATMLAVDIASAFPDRYPSAVTTAGFPAAFAVYRSHCEGFVLMSTDPAAARARLDAVYGRNGPAIRSRVAAVLAQFANGPLISDLALSWHALARSYLFRSEAALREGRLTMTDEGEHFAAGHDLSASPFHLAAHSSPVAAFRREDVGLRATRPILSATYLALGGMGVQLGERYALCHAISRACEDLFGLDAVDVVVALPKAAVPRRATPDGAVIYWDEGLTAWRICGYTEARRTLTDPHFEMSPHPADALAGGERPSPEAFLASWFSRRDAHQHRAVRHYLLAPFAASFLPVWGKALGDVASELAAKLAGEFDLVTDFLQPCWVDGAAHLLGLPARERQNVLRVTDALGAVLQRSRLDTHALRAVDASMEYLERLLRRLLGSPEPTPLVRALGEIAEVALAGEWEAVAALAQLLTAGLQPTISCAAQAWCYLEERPAIARALASRELDLAEYVDEFVRLNPPFPLLHRWARQCCDCHSVVIEPGSHIVVDVAAANRDPAVFDCPHDIVGGRRGALGLSFGYGPHSCLGASVARLQVRTALAALLTLDPPVRIAAPSEIRRGHLVAMRSLRCSRNPAPFQSGAVEPTRAD